MADHNKPTVASVYGNMIAEIDGRLDDLALGYDPATSTPTNVQTNALRWNSASNKWQKFNGSTWSDMSSLYAINISGNAATATTAGSATTAGNITGTAAVANGGTGMTTYALGDIVFASATNVLGKLADVATGKVLLSGGVGAAPAYGKVTLTGHVSGVLPVANGGTGVATLTGLVKGNGASAMTAATAAEIVAAIGSTPVANATTAASCSGNASTVTGITNGSVADSTDLNTVTSSGFYRCGTSLVNGPGPSYGQLLVTHGAGNTITQLYGDYATGHLYTRSGDPSNVGGSGAWSAWRSLIDSGNLGTGLAFSGGLLNCTVSGGTRNVQTFTSSGTWTKPGGAPADAIAIIEVWGGGGSGGKGANNAAGGGGGGGLYRSKIVPLSALAATVATTVGAGGSAQTTASTHGNAGGASSFGSLVVAQGGGGGGLAAVSSTNDAPVSPGGGGGGGGGCGQTTAGQGAGAHVAALGGNGGAGAASATNAIAGLFGDNAGGGGGGAQASRPGANGGDSISGGGGGGGGGVSAANAPGNGGVSSFGGNGGAGAYDANAATAGTAPGGGGGGSETGTSGAGANGKVVVTVIW